MFRVLKRRLQVSIQGIVLVTMLAGIVVPLTQAFATTPANAAGTPTLATDKLDYAPEEIVQVSGAGFDPNQQYAIPVMRPNETIVHGDGSFDPGWDLTTSDANGNLLYSYQLDGIQGQYEIHAYAADWSGNWADPPIASITFSDASAGNLDQCRNGTFAAPVACTGGAWVNGNAGASNSHWREDESIAYRMAMNGLTVTPGHTLTIEWDTTKGGKHAIDYLTTYNRTEVSANPCSGIAGCGSPTTFAIPLDPNYTGLTPQDAGVFTCFNCTITGLSSYTVSGSYAGDSSTRITITFTPTNSTPVISWSGHIGSQIDWGAGNSAVNISGSPYHTSLFDLDGGGGSQDRSLSAAAVVAPPTITTQVSASNISNGDSVTDLTTLTGSNGAVTGSVSFFVCQGAVGSPPNCATGGTQVGGAVAVSAGTATSSAFTPTADGTYCFRAEYRPDATAQYSVGNHTNTTTECFTMKSPGLTITKTADAASVSAGDTIGFTVVVSNNASPGGTAKGVTLSDPLPTGTGITWTISPSVAGCSIASNTLSCSFGDMAPGASTTVHVTSPTTAASCATYNNTATAHASNASPDITASASTIVECPSLAITKVADAASVSAGSPIGFTITLTNNGTGIARSVTLSDPLPAGSGISWSISPAVPGCSIASGTLTCSFGDMAPAASQAIHVTSPTTSQSCATYNNQASAQATNNSAVQASASATVACSLIAITKVADASSVSAGSPIGFLITVTNNGTGSATGVAVSDTLPTNAGITWSIDAGGSDTGCSISSGVLSCSFGTLGSGASKHVHITSPTTSASCGTVNNTADVTTTNDGSANASASIQVRCPNLAISKTADATTVSAGDPIGFTILVTNNGTGTATNVTLSDPLPSGPGITWSVSPSVVGCSIGSGTLTCSFGDLGAGASASVHVTSGTSAASCATYDNTATAQASNNAAVQASAAITVQCPTLQITKIADAAAVSAGDPIGFTISVSNAGPGTAHNVTLSDVLPTGTGITWSVSPSVSGCSISSGTLTCSFGNLASGASASVHVSSSTTAASCAVYTNTATTQADNNAPVQSAQAAIEVKCPNLAITKTADFTTVSAGDPIGFTITVQNNGTGVAHGVTLSDALPTGSGISWSETPDDPDCSISFGSLSCSFGDLAPGAMKTVHVSSPTTAASCQAYPNTAMVQGTNNAQVQASASTTVLCAAIDVAKAADDASVSAGDAIGFTITVTNNGDGIARNVSLSDLLPTDAGTSWSIDGGTYATYTTCAIAAGSLDCGPSDLAAGASYTVHVSSPTTAATALSSPVENTADVTTTNDGNDSATDSVEVLGAAIGITKTADQGTVDAGDPIGYVITVTNSGTGTAKNVTVTDTLPTNAGLSWSIDSAQSDSGCSISSGTLTCTFGSLLPGTSSHVHITSPTTTATCGTVDNSANVTSTNAGTADVNHVLIHVNCPGLGITKTADALSVDAGDQIGFLITVSNSGPGVTKSVTLSDPLPAGTGVTWTVAGGSGAGSCSIGAGTLTCNFGNMAAGSSLSVHVTSPTTKDSCKTYNNKATATATNAGPVDASASTQVKCAIIGITKVADQAQVNAGTAIGFVITVSNTGAGTAKNVSVSDPLPTNAGLSWSIDATHSDSGCSISGGTLTCTFGNLPPGTSKHVHITSPTTTATCGGTVNNTAIVTTSNAGSAQASASITVKCNAPVAQITPTQTTCQQFRDGTSPTLAEVTYQVAKNKISNEQPGVFFYYVKITAPSPSFIIDLNQTKDTSGNHSQVLLFHVQNDDPNQIILFNQNCVKYTKVQVTSIGPGDVKLQVTGATTGQFLILSVKYSPKSIEGSVAPNPTTVQYTFKTLLGVNVVGGSAQNLNLVKKNILG